MEHLITTRIRRMGEVIFSLYVSVHIRGVPPSADGGRVPPSQVRMGGTPFQLRMGDTPFPGQDGGYPLPSSGRGYPPIILFRPGKEVPLILTWDLDWGGTISRPCMGYPLPQWQDGGYPHPDLRRGTPSHPDLGPGWGS